MHGASTGHGQRFVLPVLLIRRYEGADRDAVWDLHNLALVGTGAHAGNGPWDDDLHDIRSAHLDAGGEFLVGVRAGRVVAMGALCRIDAGCVEMKRIRVDPAFQRRGFGRAMLQALERRAAELGYAAVRLDTTTAQVAALRFYQTEGYRETGRGVAGGFDTVLFEKRLG